MLKIAVVPLVERGDNCEVLASKVVVLKLDVLARDGAGSDSHGAVE